MVLTVRELELLKLLCWCRTIPPSEVWFSEIYGARDLRLMEHLGFAAVSRNRKYIRPRPGAYDLLQSVGYSFYGDVTPQTKQQTLDRWNTAARILFTFYLSGVDVFTDNIDTAPNIYLSALAAKGGSIGNPFGNTKFYGILRTAEMLYLVFYMDEIGVYFQKELTLFHSYTDKVSVGRTGLIFMGESLAEISESVLRTEQNEEQSVKKKYHADSFAKVFSVTSLSVHFVPIGKSGAQMLRYLTMEKYRERLSRTILRGSYQSPYEGLTDTDAIHFQAPHLPAVVALDLDIKRMDRALAAAQERGFPKIVLYALPEQTAFLRGRYDGQADIIAVDAARLEQEIVGKEFIQDRSAPYMTKDGRWVDIANFAVYRKAKE